MLYFNPAEEWWSQGGVGARGARLFNLRADCESALLIAKHVEADCQSAAGCQPAPPTLSR